MKNFKEFLFVILSPFTIIPLGLLTAPFFPKGRGNPITIPLLLFIFVADLFIVNRYLISKNKKSLRWKVAALFLVFLILGIGFLLSNTIIESTMR